MTGSRSDRTTVTAVCLEVAGPDQMSDWLDQGWMPNLRAVRDAGAFLPLRSVADISSGASGRASPPARPERHGQFFTHMQLEPGSYRIGKQYADDVPAPPFWEALSRAGPDPAPSSTCRRPARSPGFAGRMWSAGEANIRLGRALRSARRLMAEIRRRFGPHPLVDDWRVAGRPDTARPMSQALCRDLVAGARSRKPTLRAVLIARPVRPVPHGVLRAALGHAPFWDTLDDGTPAARSCPRRQHGGVMRDSWA